jgi:hypothetical protein
VGTWRLVESAGRPLPRNQAIRAAVADPRVTVELDRFNLELNATPALLAGRPFTALGGELNLLVDRVADAAKDHAGRPALVGILPTLSEADFGPGAMTDLPRYRVLDGALRQGTETKCERSPPPSSWPSWCRPYGRGCLRLAWPRRRRTGCLM